MNLRKDHYQCKVSPMNFGVSLIKFLFFFLSLRELKESTVICFELFSFEKATTRFFFFGEQTGVGPF